MQRSNRNRIVGLLLSIFMIFAAEALLSSITEVMQIQKDAANKIGAKKSEAEAWKALNKLKLHLENDGSKTVDSLKMKFSELANAYKLAGFTLRRSLMV